MTLDDFQEIFESAKNKIDEVLKSSAINTSSPQEQEEQEASDKLDKVPSGSKRARDEEILPTVEEISGYLVDEESNMNESSNRHFTEKDDRRKALKIIWSKGDFSIFNLKIQD